MLDPVISCAVYGIEALIYFVFYARVGTPRLSMWKCFLIGLCLFELTSGVNLLFHNTMWVNILSVIFFSALYARSCFRIRAMVALCYASVLAALGLALEMLVILGASSLFSVQVTGYNQDLSLLIQEFLACKTPFFLVSMLFSNFVKGSSPRKIPASLFIYPISSVICLFLFWYLSLTETISSTGHLLLAVASGILLLVTIFLFNAFQSETKKDRELERIRNENTNLRMEKDHYDILEQQNQALLSYAHDAHKHLTAIQALNTDPRIGAYVASLCGQLDTCVPAYHSGNKMLDAIISRYVLEARRRSIHFAYDTLGCALSGIVDLDLVSILGNLMDNAFAAAEASADRKVILETFARNRYSVIFLRNSCDNAPHAEEEHLQTTKPAGGHHGYGLKNVTSALQKYQGDFYWSYTPDTRLFAITVMVREPDTPFRYAP